MEYRQFHRVYLLFVDPPWKFLYHIFLTFCILNCEMETVWWANVCQALVVSTQLFAVLFHYLTHSFYRHFSTNYCVPGSVKGAGNTGEWDTALSFKDLLCSRFDRQEACEYFIYGEINEAAKLLDWNVRFCLNWGEHSLSTYSAPSATYTLSHLAQDTVL